jgi:hypothetical protein
MNRLRELEHEMRGMMRRVEVKKTVDTRVAGLSMLTDI